jgi:hypothetical protein
MPPCLFRDRQSLVDQRQGAVRPPRDGLQLCKHPVKQRRIGLIALGHIGWESLPQPTRARIWIDQPTTRPICAHLTLDSEKVHAMLFRQLDACVCGEAGGRGIAATDFQISVPIEHVDNGCGMAQFARAADRLLDQQPGALEVAQMPGHQRKKRRRARLTDNTPRVFVSLWDEVGQRTLEEESRRFQVALKEQNQGQDAASCAGFRGATIGLGFPKESLSHFLRHGKFAPLEVA